MSADQKHAPRVGDRLVPAPALRAFVQQVFERIGYSAADASAAAEVLHHADLHGSDTHGVANLVPIYVSGLLGGSIRVDAVPRWLQRHGACALLDACDGLGLLAGRQAMQAAMQTARELGIGCAAVRRSTHFGAAGFYAALARSEGLLGLALTNLGNEPVAHVLDSRDPLLGTNPIAFAAPAGRQPPLLVDISTTVTASGKIKRARRRGEPVPEGWLFDAAGAAVTDPSLYARGEARLPMLGGPRVGAGGHKGLGLGLLVEVLCGALAGARTAAQRGLPGPRSVGHFMLAIDPGFFAEPDSFGVAMDELLGSIADAPLVQARSEAPAPPLRYPGQGSARLVQHRLQAGIPLDPPLLDELQLLARDLGLAPLQTTQP